MNLDFINTVAWILRVFPTTGGVSSTSRWVHNFWWIINYCSAYSWFQQIIYNLLGLTPIVTDVTHNLAITILLGLMLTNCCIINNQSVHYVILPSRSYTWEKIINGGIALSGALSLVCISMIARKWRLAVVAKQKFGMQNYFIVQLFLFIAQIWSNYSYHIEKIESLYLLQFYIKHGLDQFIVHHEEKL